ncbi:hypothetical protein TGPRC2_237190 [Toxoplasma gondii TgCatPRC2]|uniref:Uncharacterized protein n=8 Tax=Toxoplasma gondii TaxID=5811 RepID=S7UQ29_TOXGG|nr:hypothetical protein TGME49_237190 [Toxoplasma gondii ME49]EPR60111.1 hypothetical protein TGGT1_237190 [Toxoplasma gondii GT1]KAF4640152.1 hypothetical protein TGRH88_040770 [Toxoplasma gondii]KFG35788.1 hypothetical protein TGDOM2_237190 [Toxoplasma gondii GAB2-2007-GAL-DOM2]KFG62354.1 hypothetical protein TGRUB_237190 [Toxoplasma gondii RUB]KFH07619.1 hypothetical protein TGVAND_237190 [Toxoplasma gondii VAND]KFH16308.1 hypothetical protein TGMAS_237190 [Toxoplasma gondii MAS]KYK67863.|eukprot:XP_002369071.2 hypothetical protein TGME49_237190 [Toxoplasma gondii ME49]
MFSYCCGLGMHQDRIHAASCGAANQVCAPICEPQVVLIDNLELAVHAEDQVAYYDFMHLNSTPVKATDRVLKRDPTASAPSQFENSSKGSDPRMSSAATASTMEELDEDSYPDAVSEHRSQVECGVARQPHTAPDKICLSVRPVSQQHSPSFTCATIPTAAHFQTSLSMHRQRSSGPEWTRSAVSRLSVPSEEMHQKHLD